MRLSRLRSYWAMRSTVCTVAETRAADRRRRQPHRKRHGREVVGLERPDAQRALLAAGRRGASLGQIGPRYARVAQASATPTAGCGESSIARCASAASLTETSGTSNSAIFSSPRPSRCATDAT